MVMNNGGPAFPTEDRHGHDGKDGMSLRDWFAGQDKPTLAETIRMCEVLFGGMPGGSDTWPIPLQRRARVILRYHEADAMLEQRDKE